MIARRFKRAEIVMPDTKGGEIELKDYEERVILFHSFGEAVLFWNGAKKLVNKNHREPMEFSPVDVVLELIRVRGGNICCQQVEPHGE